MKRVIMSLAAIVFLAVSTGAQAHWQYTRWGMTPDQVVIAARGAVQRADPKSDAEMPFGVKEAAGTYAAGNRSMKASFWFKEGRLSQVDLSSDNQDDCYSVKRDLDALYLSPNSTSAMSTIWIDEIKGNHIQYVNWGTLGCQIFYAVVQNSKSTGL